MQYASDGHEINPVATLQEFSGKVSRCNRGCCSVGPISPTEQQGATGPEGQQEVTGPTGPQGVSEIYKFCWSIIDN